MGLDVVLMGRVAGGTWRGPDGTCCWWDVLLVGRVAGGTCCWWDVILARQQMFRID